MKSDEEWQKFVDDSIKQAMAFYDESLDNRFGQVMEALDTMREQTAKIPKMEADIGELKTDMKAVKVAIKATNDDLRNLGHAW